MQTSGADILMDSIGSSSNMTLSSYTSLILDFKNHYAASARMVTYGTFVDMTLIGRSSNMYSSVMVF